MNSALHKITKGRQWLRESINQLARKERMFYVISHERSGTHFTINSIVNNTYIKAGHHNIGEWFGPYDDYAHRFDHIDSFNNDWAEHGKQHTVIKSHCDLDLFEKRYHPGKVIYVYRDPRDTMTSWFHFLNRPQYWDYMKRHNPDLANPSCDKFSDFLRRPLCEFLRYDFSLHGDFTNIVERWASHVRDWTNRTDILPVRYEDLHLNYENTVLKMTKFLGLRPHKYIQPIKLKGAPSVAPRKGIIGDWVNHFSGDDELFVRNTIEKYGLEWSELTYTNTVESTTLR